jgi:hypothetical protein
MDLILKITILLYLQKVKSKNLKNSLQITGTIECS